MKKIEMNLTACKRCMTLLTWLLHIATSEPIIFDAVETSSPSYVSIFSPRMDFDQWKPLTGRGDPLRNDPTYDYEPPVLERVHYWADESRLEREHYPDRKSEVLMLGVSSRKPSTVSRTAVPPRKHHRSPPPKYEDFTYKLNDHYPMTILVPPPPPPPGHKPSLYILTDDKIPIPTLAIQITVPTSEPKITTITPDIVTSYAVQEANLIYQSSTTNQNWISNYNQTEVLPKNSVSSDYAGWGPTTPFEKDSIANETLNFIFDDHKIESNKELYSFYKPLLESSQPQQTSSNAILLPTFVPTALPPMLSTISSIQTAEQYTTTTETSVETQGYFEDSTIEKNNTYLFLPTPTPSRKTKPSIVDMLRPMMSMPMIPDATRPEDNLYAHASDIVHVFKEHPIKEDSIKLEAMQTMQPPPFSKLDSMTTVHHQPVHINPYSVNNLINDKPATFTHDPYLNMRHTTSIIPLVNASQDTKTTTEAPALPMYLIIQGHSKVKTYGSKTKTPTSDLSNEIPRLNETNEVKHLHPIKQKHTKKSEKQDLVHRAGRANNLKSLVDNGLGSIEIQETDMGIKYDISDGSDVPIEIYRKGIVDTGDYHFSSNNNVTNENRIKRQIGLDDLLPFDEDTLEEYVYNFFRGKRNVTGITGVIAQAVTSNFASATLDKLEDNDDGDDDNNSRTEDR